MGIFEIIFAFFGLLFLLLPLILIALIYGELRRIRQSIEETEDTNIQILNYIEKVGTQNFSSPRRE